MLIQEQFVQCPEQGRFNVRAHGWPDSDHWMTPSPPELQLHQGSKRSSTAPMAPRHLLSRFYTFFFFPNTSILFSFHLLCRSAACQIPCCSTPQVPTLRVLLFHRQPDLSSIFATRLRSAGGEKANRFGKQT